MENGIDCTKKTYRNQDNFWKIPRKMVKFRSWKTLTSHGKFHGKSWNFKSSKEYELWARCTHYHFFTYHILNTAAKNVERENRVKYSHTFLNLSLNTTPWTTEHRDLFTWQFTRIHRQIQSTKYNSNLKEKVAFALAKPFLLKKKMLKAQVNGHETRFL